MLTLARTLVSSEVFLRLGQGGELRGVVSLPRLHTVCFAFKPGVRCVFTMEVELVTTNMLSGYAARLRLLLILLYKHH